VVRATAALRMGKEQLITIGGWDGPRDDLDALEMGKIFCPYWESNHVPLIAQLQTALSHFLFCSVLYLIFYRILIAFISA